MMVQNKGQEESEGVSPEDFDKDFSTLNIFDKAEVTLYEISKIPQEDEDEFDYEEGGEDENEEMEDEQEE